jgi:lipid-A-disaccharide synthase
MKYYIIAGEASGDLHGSNLMKELYKIDPQAEIRFWGGDLMSEVGGTCIKHYKDLAFMGFAEVLLNIRTILNNISFCKADILSFNPDKIIYIDYPGFNLRIAKWAKKQHFQNHFYIAPQIWAWKENRIKQIKKSIDKLYVILPFEKPYFENKHHFRVSYVGHPLLDAINRRPKKNKADFLAEHQLADKPIIALLPGSRKQEVNKMLNIMLSVLNDFPDYQFIIAGAPGLPQTFYQPFLKDKQICLVQNKTYDLLDNSHAALVTSGTATLETALFKVPEIVCYKGSNISYEIAKRVIKLKFISLVNLIMDEEVVKELIQHELNHKNLKKELQKILKNENREKLLFKYNLLISLLGQDGASQKVANEIFAY